MRLRSFISSSAGIAALALGIVPGCSHAIPGDCTAYGGILTFVNGHALGSAKAVCKTRPISYEAKATMEWWNDGPGKWEDAAKPERTHQHPPVGIPKTYYLHSPCYPGTRMRVVLHLSGISHDGKAGEGTYYAPSPRGEKTNNCGEPERV